MNNRESIRSLKKRILKILKQRDFDEAWRELLHIPMQQAINALLSFLYHNEEPEIKWHAVSLLGVLVSRLAQEDMEAARVIIRRLMWNLNDESGGIGWGSPEAMGEILAAVKVLAVEYAPMLMSYAKEEGNFQENSYMQRGVLWALARLASRRPELLEDVGPHIIPFLQSTDATIRGLAAWITGLLGVEEARPGLEDLMDDDSRIQIYQDGKIGDYCVKDLAREALKRLICAEHLV